LGQVQRNGGAGGRGGGGQHLVALRLAERGQLVPAAQAVGGGRQRVLRQPGGIGVAVEVGAGGRRGRRALGRGGRGGQGQQQGGGQGREAGRHRVLLMGERDSTAAAPRAPKKVFSRARARGRRRRHRGDEGLLLLSEAFISQEETFIS